MANVSLSFEFELAELRLELLVIQDRRKLLERDTGYWSEDRRSEVLTAAIKYENKVNNRLQTINDLILARSIAKAMEVDASEIGDLTKKELQAQLDHEIALKLSYGADIEAFSGHKNFTSSHQDLDLLTLPSEGIQQKNSSFLPLGQTDVPNKPNVQRYVCISCFCDLDEGEKIFVGCPKGHTYCEECLRGYFVKAISDENLFPPKCCGKPILFSLVAKYFNVDETKDFIYAEIEYTTSNRVYCFNCKRFIPGAGSSDSAKCKFCNHETCARCKKGTHIGDCPPDDEEIRLLELANQRGWPRCFNCRSLVERDRGCNHMTCRCGAEFCYRCTGRWKTCYCTDFEY